MEKLGWLIPALNLEATSTEAGIIIRYADGAPMPQDQQTALLNRVRDAVLSALVVPLK